MQQGGEVGARYASALARDGLGSAMSWEPCISIGVAIVSLLVLAALAIDVRRYLDDEGDR